jgi:hypothetical protein
MKRDLPLLLLVMVLFCLSGYAQEQKVTKVEINTVPADHRIRPFENVVVQLVVYADVIDKNGNKKNERVKRNADSFRIKDKDGGWLSKPFFYQGIEGIASILENRLSGLLGTAQEFVVQDSVLYTAPEKPGKYTIEATLGSKQAQTVIEVNSKAPSYRKPEKANFQPEPVKRDPYGPLAEHYAPWIAQETWFTPKADYLARFDYDGDWRGDNNWEDLETGSSQAYVYYAAMETETHWFLVYNFYHPRDYSDKCVAGTCHENDNEGLIMTIAKDGSQYGRLQTMETLAHNNVYSFRADNRIKDGVHDIDGDIEWVGSHPVAFIESGGHGVYASTTRHARFGVKNQFTAGTGVTFVYKGKAERPRYANDREVGYELLPIYEQWWKKADPSGGWRESTFDEFFTYQPQGGRPSAAFPTIPGTFLGRKQSSNKAKPFWGWHDNLTLKKNVLSVGQWALDPAYAVSRDLRFPEGERFSLDYIYNPYLDLGSKGPASNITLGPFPRQPTAPIIGRVGATIGAPIGAPIGHTNQGNPPSSSNSGDFSGSGLAALPELPAYRSHDYKANSKEGTLILRLIVDGEIELRVQGDKIHYTVASGLPPREDGSEFTQPIPRTKLKSFKVDKKDGRGEIQLLEQPAPGNDYTARIRIDDPKGGDDKYRIEVKWKR